MVEPTNLPTSRFIISLEQDKNPYPVKIQSFRTSCHYLQKAMGDKGRIVGWAGNNMQDGLAVVETSLSFHDFFNLVAEHNKVDCFAKVEHGQPLIGTESILSDPSFKR